MIKLGFKRAIVSLSISAIALLWTGVPAHASPAVPKWATEFLAAWYTAYNAGDAKAVASMFTVDATLGQDKGRTAIEKTLAEAFSSTTYRCSGRFEAFREIDGMAVAWGVDSCTEISKVKGPAVLTRERWLVVFERQADGRWMIARETWEDLRP